MSTIEIRPLTHSDETDWRRLWTRYLEFYETTLSEEVYQTAFSRLLSDDPNQFHGMLALVDGTPVGLVHYLFHRNLWSVEDTCYLMDLFCDPDLRGKGVGRALIEAVYDAADKAGAPSVYWKTQEFNYKGRMLYDRVGKRSSFIVYERP